MIHSRISFSLRPSWSWWISGLTSWEHALGWSPAWDHATLFDTTHDPWFFGLRVGYGNAYDEHTQRTYEQVREHALAPYRALLALRRMHETAARGDTAASRRTRPCAGASDGRAPFSARFPLAANRATPSPSICLLPPSRKRSRAATAND